jgi:hypothetical protein
MPAPKKAAAPKNPKKEAQRLEKARLEAEAVGNVGFSDSPSPAPTPPPTTSTSDEKAAPVAKKEAKKVSQILNLVCL